MTVLVHREFKESAFRSEISARSRTMKGNFLHCPIPQIHISRHLLSQFNVMKMIIWLNSWHSCLKCLQQVKHEYSLVKNKLETLFKVSRRFCREIILFQSTIQILYLQALLFYMFTCSWSNSLLLPVAHFLHCEVK